MFLVGLTGGIASGKTLVSDTFATLGAHVVDADVLARIAVEPGSEGLNMLVDAFGPSIISEDNALNRAALRELIFSHPEHRKTVDEILHPIIRQLSEDHINNAEKQGFPYVVYAVPLLVETAQQERFDRILVVDVPVETQLQRLIKRDGGNKEKAQAIVDAQASREERLAIADDVIDNSGSIDEVQNSVANLHKQYLELAQLEHTQ